MITLSRDTYINGKLNIESSTGDTIFNLGGIKGSGGSEFAYVRNSKRTQMHDTGSNTTVLFPQKSGELALTSDVDTRGAKNTANDKNNGWWKCGDTGMIFQWGFDGRGGSATEKTVTFPFAFKTACFNVQITPSYVNGSPDAAILLKAISGTSFTSYRVSGASYNFYWYAIGK